MSRRQKHLFEFGRFTLDVSNGLLLRDGQPVSLHPKAFDTLLLLIARRDEVLGKEELMQNLWPDSVVEESNLSQNIYVLRKVLGQEGEGQEWIKTIPKRGYRFIGDVRELRGDIDVILEEQVTSRITIEEQTGRELKQYEQAAVIAGELKGRAFSRTKLIVPGVVAIAVVAGGFLLVQRFLLRKSDVTEVQRATIEPFQRMKLTRLTDIGKAYSPAISPDGTYLAYVVRDDPGGQSLWIKHIPTGSTTQIVAPAAGVALENLVFSKDGGLIYYIHTENTVTDLYLVPILGMSPRKLLDNVWGRVGLSHDGKRLAFLRSRWSEGEFMLHVVDIDGANERVVATRTRPRYFNVFGVGPEWSPDGRFIALSGGTDADGGYDEVIEVRVEDGAQRSISDRKWRSVGQVAWLSDGSGLLVASRERDSPNQQVWLLSYPDGSVRRVTNDLNYYERISLTSDSSFMVAEQSEHISNIWVASGASDAVGTTRALQITTGKNGRDGFYGVAWTPDGKVVFSSSAGGTGYDLWIAEPNGSNRRQLTFAGGNCAYPAVSPDGRFIVFSSDRMEERNIWRIDIDGRNPVRLTEGQNELHSSFTPDGRWVVYESGDTTSRLWKVPIEGGTPVQLNGNYASGGPVVSPDGMLIAFNYYTEREKTPWRLGIMRTDNGEMIKSFPQPFRSFQWTVDGQSLTYISGTSTVSNIWSQPLDAGGPAPLTDFKDKRIYWFDWSRDGKWLALARGESINDVVMITDFK